MPTQNDDFRAFSYWPSDDERRVISIKRSPEVDAMTDDELISRRRQRDSGADTRLITRDAGGSRESAVVHRTPENDAMTDAELFAALDEWKRARRHLQATDDAE
ncbi:hypothetical protein [Streptomyces sp. NBC_01361]|uniref:hypothetical protein n=1 Tax=Streptomyces sp. NBC_01361 TaxID=2903838 RepID=UPI002E332631|nr:hypothetical protein [Streptomyces sp. NBC_01361]